MIYRAVSAIGPRAGLAAVALIAASLVAFAAWSAVSVFRGGGGGDGPDADRFAWDAAAPAATPAAADGGADGGANGADPRPVVREYWSVIGNLDLRAVTTREQYLETHFATVDRLRPIVAGPTLEFLSVTMPAGIAGAAMPGTPGSTLRGSTRVLALDVERQDGAEARVRSVLAARALVVGEDGEAAWIEEEQVIALDLRWIGGGWRVFNWEQLAVR